MQAHKLSRQQLRQLVDLVSSQGLRPNGEPTKYHDLMVKLIEVEDSLHDNATGIIIFPSYVEEDYQGRFASLL